MISVPWFICIFVNSLPLSVSLRALDMFFYEGSTFIFKLALSILQINYEMLTKPKNEDLILPEIKSYL